LQDVMTTHAIQKEPDPFKREAMIRGGTILKTYPEIGPLYWGDKIMWRPIDVNNQEYSVQGRYRIGNQAFLDTEEIRIVNIGEQFVSPQTMLQIPIWQFSVTVKNESEQILMHCVDSKFPRDDHWIDGPPCFPGPNYGPQPRSLCARCLRKGFEFVNR